MLYFYKDKYIGVYFEEDWIVASRSSITNAYVILNEGEEKNVKALYRGLGTSSGIYINNEDIKGGVVLIEVVILQV